MVPHGSEGVSDLLTPVVAAAGLVLEGVTVTPAGRRRVVRVVVDLPEDATGVLDLDVVAAVSRAVDDALEQADVFSAPYVLEVTSPGVDRPLTQRRHWSRARGRTVRVSTGDGAEVTGRVVSVSDEGVAVDVEGASRLLPWDGLGPGRVQVEFNRPDPLDDAPED